MKKRGYNSNCSKCPNCKKWNRWDQLYSVINRGKKTDKELCYDFIEKPHEQDPNWTGGNWKFKDTKEEELYEVNQCQKCGLIVKVIQEEIPIIYEGRNTMLIQDKKWRVIDHALRVKKL